MIVQTCRQSSAEDSIGEGGSGRPLQDTDVAESVGAEGEGGGRSTFNPDGAMRRSYEHSESTAERCQRIATRYSISQTGHSQNEDRSYGQHLRL